MLPAQPHAGPGPALPARQPAPALIWARLAPWPSPAALPSLPGARTLDISRGVRGPSCREVAAMPEPRPWPVQGCAQRASVSWLSCF